MLIPSTKTLICSLDLPEVAIKHGNINMDLWLI
jgi:hypothetical protein